MPTSMRTSHYEVLGVSPGATPGELKSAYRAKVKQLHPDSGGTEEAFEALQVAWSVLGNPDKRGEYDAWLRDTRPVLGGTRLSVQQRFEERELEVERRAWEARRNAAREKAAAAAAARRAAEEAADAEQDEHVDVHRHLTMGAAGLVVLVSALELGQGNPGGDSQVELFGTTFTLPPSGTTMVVIQMLLGALVLAASVVARPPLHGGTPVGFAAVTSSRQFRVAVGVAAGLLALWVVVPFLVRAL